MPAPEQLWAFILPSYLLTIALETPVLMLGMSPRHDWRLKLLAGVLLTACTYPIVYLVLPLTVGVWWGYAWYLAIAETFAPAAECAIFAAAVWPGKDLTTVDRLRDMGSIVAANLVSFLLGWALVNWWVQTYA